VRILYDNSGSMFPGYRPPGAAERVTRAALGVHYVHQSPAFAEWLDDFVQRQSLVNGTTAGMWTSTSNGSFTPTDIREVHPVVALRDFRASTAMARFPLHAGNSSYLTESLNEFTRDFTGLVWLITDNIVETGVGEPDAGVQQLFRTLADRPEIRSVHLFKYPFEENGQTAALAVYGLLVSQNAVSPETLADYDTKLRQLQDAKRFGANAQADLFPGREYLKLKDLSIEPIRPDIRLLLPEGDKGTFREGQNVELRVEGQIRSLLTHHTVTSGRYELAIDTPFRPDASARRDLGAQPLAAAMFNPVAGEIGGEILPGGARAIREQLRSNQPLSLRPRGLGAWLRLAWDGGRVRYSGTARMSFRDVRVRLEPQRMAGIFGIDHVPTIFVFQDVARLPEVPPSVVPLGFTVRTGNSRTAILLAALTLLAAIVAGAVFFFSRKRAYRITISNGPETIAALRPLRGHDVTLDGKLLGRLSRSLMNGHAFRPVSGRPGLTVVPSADADTWEVKLAGEPVVRRLSIRAEKSGSTVNHKPAKPGLRGRPRPAGGPSSKRLSPGPPPRLGRR
jgi:hypothetical protein